jgi:hypothetical protein|tara:strand:+ start:6761 stop:7183 length:423 start_codon:yes stop_codon:yes gene_type:complete
MARKPYEWSQAGAGYTISPGELFPTRTPTITIGPYGDSNDLVQLTITREASGSRMGKLEVLFFRHQEGRSYTFSFFAGGYNPDSNTEEAPNSVDVDRMLKFRFRAGRMLSKSGLGIKPSNYWALDDLVRNSNLPAKYRVF